MDLRRRHEMSDAILLCIIKVELDGTYHHRAVEMAVEHLESRYGIGELYNRTYTRAEVLQLVQTMADSLSRGETPDT